MTGRAAMDILRVHNGEIDIVRIMQDGRVIWRGREVETDDAFRSAMLDMANAIRLGCSNDSQRARMN